MPKIKNILFIICIEIFFLSASSSADPFVETQFKETDPTCESVHRIEATGTVPRLGGTGTDRECFEMLIDGEGILKIDILTRSAIEPHLGILPGSVPPRGPQPIYLDRWVGGGLIAFDEPGTVIFEITAPSLLQTLPEYKLESVFLSRWLPQKSEDEDEDESEIVVDPIVGAATGTGHDLCRIERPDDHADTLRCASSIPLYGPVSGKLENHRGDDTDVFTFQLFEWKTLRIESDGPANVIVLYDRDGQRLATHVRGDSFPSVFAKALAPGRYFLRIEGEDRAEGAYRLWIDMSP